MHHTPMVAAVTLAVVMMVTGCSAQPLVSTAPSPAASQSPSADPTPIHTIRDRCEAFTSAVAELLGSEIVKRDDRSLSDGVEACWWQTDYSGYIAALSGPAPLDFVAILDDLYDEPTAWHRSMDSPMWATGQGVGGQASWTSKDESVQTGIIARGIDGDRLMDLMGLAAEIAQY
ncbi:hypothetical protein GCM10010413_52050 [Promicromonospora sukumoe]|uniref:Lipoprotein n=1 Tax=Promicromonospora sukumoe TaxID=88382 RepID=A0A7W3JD55_9MICO|nr:hypothetical protein [Promicromonospora sukumoe]MBA8810651.1 hypothetical protein [Promicromonospora sukumoe]